MKQYRILSLLLVLSTLFTLPITASAVDNSSTIQLEPFNEYSYIQTLQSSSVEELESLGVSPQEAQKTISEYERSLFERAQLSDSELRAYGYDNAEIELFHAYADGQVLSYEQLYSLGSTCYADIVRESCSPTTATFSYVFTWNRCPIMTLSDSAAMRWIVYDENGEEIGVQQTSSSMIIEYHFKGNAASDGSDALAHLDFGTNEPNLDFNTLNMQFDVYQPHISENGSIFDCYAKRGTVKVSIKVPNGINQTIHHIFVGGLYGHTLIGIGSPAVSVTPDSIGISFTGNTSIDSIASRKATIYRTSAVVEYW